MKVRGISKIFVALFVSIGSVLFGQQKVEEPIKWTAGVMTGYNRGFGLQANLTARNFNKEFPVQLRLGIGLNLLNPGNASDARRIFINNATNGVPEKHGRSIDYKLDFLIPKTIFNVDHSFLVLGPRFSTFRGNFKYVGGNEDFDVISHQWGAGADLENHFKLVKNIEFVLAMGLDFYLPGKLEGHDTSYSPDNDNVNANEDNQNNNRVFTYKDADKAIRQPRFMPHLMVGINFRL